MPTLRVELDLDVPCSFVWETLCRNDHWYQWNSFLFDRHPNQTLTLGHSLVLSLQRIPSESETKFQAIVTHVEPDTRLQWIAIAPGYRSKHTFELYDLGPHRTKYIHKETVSGLLSPLFFPFIKKDEQRGIRRMAMELKDYAEAQYSNTQSYPG
ncbi:MAG: SRPBCC domain-containing protein [Leptolyngbyaceae bacterium]|nr:SRPBCC domain-containing protein [Leptolyngbyaceae bacterium]